MNEILEQYRKAVISVLDAFSKKHEYPNYEINDNEMQLIDFGDNILNLNDIIYDLQNDCPKNLIFEWHLNSIDACFEKKQLINFRSYSKGLRYDFTK